MVYSLHFFNVAVLFQVAFSQTVQRSGDVNCDFEKFCPAWRNATDGRDDNFNWQIAQSVILDSWHSIPRSKDGPGDQFAYAQGTNAPNAGNNHFLSDTAILVSDTIQCQRGNGKFTFWYWKTSNLPVLEICLRAPGSQFGAMTECVDRIDGIHAQEWIMRVTTIPNRPEPFQIVIRAYFKHNFDIVGIDEIKYEADLCADASTSTNSSSPTPTTPPNSTNQSIAISPNKNRTTKTSHWTRKYGKLLGAVHRHQRRTKRQTYRNTRARSRPQYSLDGNILQTEAIDIPKYGHPAVARPMLIVAQEIESQPGSVVHKAPPAPLTTTTTTTTTTAQPTVVSTTTNLPTAPNVESSIDASILAELAKLSAAGKAAAPVVSGTPEWLTLIKELAPMVPSVLKLGEALPKSEDIIIPPFGDYGMNDGATDFTQLGLSDTAAVGAILAQQANEQVVNPIYGNNNQISGFGAPPAFQPSAPAPQFSNGFGDFANVIPGSQGNSPGSRPPTSSQFDLLNNQHPQQPPFGSPSYVPDILNTYNNNNGANDVANPQSPFPTPKPLIPFPQPPPFDASLIPPELLPNSPATGGFNSFSQPATIQKIQDRPSDLRAKETKLASLLPKNGEQFCPAVNCNMDRSSFCQYDNGQLAKLGLPSDATAVPWKLSDQPVANSLTGILTDASGAAMFGYAGNQEGEHSYYVLSSQPVRVQPGSAWRVEFAYYHAGVEGRLRVCVDDLSNCPFTSLGQHVKTDSRKWQMAGLQLPVGQHTVHFVADKLRKNYVIGLDEITLRVAGGSELANCR